jgi:protein TonB
MNRRLVLAIAVSLSINIMLVIFLLNLMKFDVKKEEPKSIPIKLKYSKLINDIPNNKPITETKKKEIQKPKAKPKEKIEKKKHIKKVKPIEPIKKQKLEDTLKNKINKTKQLEKKIIKPTKVESKKIPKPDKKKELKKEIIKPKEILKEPIKEQPKPRSGLAGLLSESSFEKEIKKVKSPSDRMIESLYSPKELSEISNTQKKFLKDNLDNISKITQYYLNRVGYPDVARRMKAVGLCVLEFYLFPDGYISDIKLVKSTGYESLDKNSIFVVEVAHRRYPKPREKTLIRMFVHYTH